MRSPLKVMGEGFEPSARGPGTLVNDQTEFAKLVFLITITIVYYISPPLSIKFFTSELVFVV